VTLGIMIAISVFLTIIVANLGGELEGRQHDDVSIGMMLYGG
jgi:hypothetical protein